MNMVITKKNIFLNLAKQLRKEDLKYLKPYVDELYYRIDLYTITENDKDLIGLLNVLITCISITKYILIGYTTNLNVISTIKERPSFQ
ncbi:ORF_33 [Adoxophyes orana granulovirus]|uniref:ORF_33 n=1 Tax=Adoxophyes orana granulovirus TaxID=170617 RepID=Q7T9Y2_GVAO|nr:ORF_33 [Adoxophyes orana granulovirus]AAP85670.1 ORF_33 [Adoxophyes orana granulovirus]